MSRVCNVDNMRHNTAEAKRRATHASVVSGLRTALEPDEQLLAFARGKIAGGWRGKLNIGPEAFIAPFVNVGLTERRLVLQHIHAETGAPSELLPHYFLLDETIALTYSEIEVFGGEPACRLVLSLNSEQHFRLRFLGELETEGAKAIAEVYSALMQSRKPAAAGPTTRTCPSCESVLDQPARFCPYCGTALPSDMQPGASQSPAAATEADGYRSQASQRPGSEEDNLEITDPLAALAQRGADEPARSDAGVSPASDVERAEHAVAVAAPQAGSPVSPVSLEASGSTEPVQTPNPPPTVDQKENSYEQVAPEMSAEPPAATDGLPEGAD
ncbi:MAG TPA: hypothetical protein VGS41_07345 [Chthonomonadales bacterium]|nr:hypothetical protein [Chthonomonadales bacterium]